jgi:GNAT superfamily N-acetyltransferase
VRISSTYRPRIGWRYPYPAPVLSLARLATDERDRGREIGSRLLAHMFVLAAKMADELGCVGVVVDSKAGALQFYEKYGFKPRVSHGHGPYTIVGPFPSTISSTPSPSMSATAR